MPEPRRADTAVMTNRTDHGPSDDVRRAADGALRLESPDPYQLVWMEELREFLRGPGIDLTVPAHVEKLFIDWCSRWHATTPSERWNPLPSLTALGVAVGDLVRAERPDLNWRVVTGCNPTTLVLADATGRAVASPLTDVATWWMSRELSGIAMLLARFGAASVPKAQFAELGTPQRPAARSVV